MLTEIENSFMKTQMLKSMEYVIKPIHMAAHMLDPTPNIQSIEYEMKGIAYIVEAHHLFDVRYYIIDDKQCLNNCSIKHLAKTIISIKTAIE